MYRRLAAPESVVASLTFAHRLYFLKMTHMRFGTDGWRAVIAEDFTVENVRKVAHAIARYVVRAEKPGSGVLVGYDTRFGSERFARAAAEAVAAAGTPVWLASEEGPPPARLMLLGIRKA